MAGETGIFIRESIPGDLSALEDLYRTAFPQEEVFPLVNELLKDAALALSLVAEAEASLAGHALFTLCEIVGRPERLALLGPVAVAPAWQGHGVGRTLIRQGLRRLEDLRIARVLVLGDPGYYQRFGFGPETHVTPPYPLPLQWREAWQSAGLSETATPVAGQLNVPGPWRRPELWAP